MNEIQVIDKKVEREVRLKEYKGPDRVVYADDLFRELEEERKNIPPFIAKTGLVTLDETTEGFRKGQLIVLSGPPKNGKSQIAATFTSAFWKDSRCLWFQFELAYYDFLSRFPVNPEGKIDFYIPRETRSDNLEWIEERIVEAKQKNGVDIVFIDHLDFLRDPAILRGLKGYQQNTATYVGGIVQKVKRMAIEHDIVIFLLSHIRKTEWTTNELPNSEELRDSGQIAQLADIVLMVIRKRAAKKADEVYDSNKALLGVMENRHNGRTKKIPLVYNFVEKLYHETSWDEWGKSETGTADNSIRDQGEWV